MNRNLCIAAFLAGLISLCWVGAGYIGSSPLALAMTAVIGAVYVMGALELRRFHRGTSALAHALATIPDDLQDLGDWLGRLPPKLQNPVRLRIEGERVALPGPAMAPYLVGLLVLLGMLGTFLGMVVTLKGAVIALESTTDLHTIRAALAAPVKGLGVAFGTSVAGVAASAMLGLMSALCRRERLRAAQVLDTRIATVLRRFSLTHQRQETFKALQLQAGALPDAVEKLQAMMAQMERQSQQLNERLLANQDNFHQETKGAYSELATSIDKSLKESLTESARLAGATIQPIVEATMAGIAREATSLHQLAADTVKAQLDGISERFSVTVTTVADTWTGALAKHERTSEDFARNMGSALEGFASTFEQRSASLLAAVSDHHAAFRTNLATTLAEVTRETASLHEGMADTVKTQLDGLSARFNTALATVTEAWTDALAKHEHTSENMAGGMQRSLEAFTHTFEERSASLLASVEQRQSALLADLASRDLQRLEAMTQSLETMAAALQDEWQQAGTRALTQQQQICATLDETARAMAAQAEAQASNTISEVTRLMQTAAEAPRAAAEVIGQLRQELSNSIARDNDLLAERSRIMETLGTLLDAINHASREQRGAIDSLVASSAALLDRAGSEFKEKIESESTKMADVATQIIGSSVEVASLSEAFSLAVQLFSESNDKLVANLQRIEGSLGKSMARSDEQLAYYVAQAREIIDLSIMSQERIVEDLQQISGKMVTGEVR